MVNRTREDRSDRAYRRPRVREVVFLYTDLGKDVIETLNGSGLRTMDLDLAVGF